MSEEAKELQKELEKAEIEIEEMAMQLADMLGAALYFAGVKKEDLPKAIDLLYSAPFSRARANGNSGNVPNLIL